MYDPGRMLNLAVAAVEDKKAHSVVTLNLQGISVICDYFLICSGNSKTQVQAIADNTVDKLRDEGFRLLRSEGLKEGRWVLLDFGDVVVHVFQDEERDYYNLERLWADAAVVHY